MTFDGEDGELDSKAVGIRVAPEVFRDLTVAGRCSDEHLSSAESFFLEYDICFLEREALHDV